ncbi:hypothetical protein I6F09_24740 [Bradyrhizobium sp. IC3195]|uniref:hypothetical protein n=1 Tax=Bradyrhizobium sp. IC3195 TaxID=2793804 RepID=UPI001CD79D28|nr:hypothetical protein [Bradyrhizobium sp. IC3195]MCA1471082.1 hypothetical protein [Bradyrhizobium sp. IC3195]
MARDSPEDKDYIHSVLQYPPNRADVTGRLVCTVCISQRLAIFLNGLETHGIGGVVAGCSISKEGFRWSPDTLHVILRGQNYQPSNDLLSNITTCTRHDVLVVRNNLNDDRVDCFATGFASNFGLERKEIVQKILADQDNLPSFHTGVKVGYVVFHDVTTQLSTIFDVRSGSHPNLTFSVQEMNGWLNLHFAVSGNGRGALRRSSGPEGNIAFVPLDYS